MPPVAYDLEDNPLFKALKKKSAQLRGASEKFLKCIILVDVGCDLLRRLSPMGHMEISGQKIIRHALDKLDIDIVCVFSPYRPPPTFLGTNRSDLSWRVTCFDHRENLAIDEYARLNRVALFLLSPRYEGYQARSLHEQNYFDPQSKGQYIATNLTCHHWDNRVVMKISSRLLNEYLAGRITRQDFDRSAFGSMKNQFEFQLRRGLTIRDVHFENQKLDEDDDYIVFDLGLDWGAASLRSDISRQKRTRHRVMSRIKNLYSTVRGFVSSLRVK